MAMVVKGSREYYEKEVKLLQKFCKGYEMYDSEYVTESATTIVTNCWFPDETVKRVLVDMKNEKVFVLEETKESESEFLMRLVG